MLDKLSSQARAYLHDYFSQHELSRLLKVDYVLALLRGGYIEDAEHIAGVPIQYGKPALHLRNSIIATISSTQDDRRILRVAPNPRLPTTPAWSRYRQLRAGLTLRQVMRRGVTRRDIREALSHKWIEVDK